MGNNLLCGCLTMYYNNHQTQLPIVVTAHSLSLSLTHTHTHMHTLSHFLYRTKSHNTYLNNHHPPIRACIQHLGCKWDLTQFPIQWGRCKDFVQLISKLIISKITIKMHNVILCTPVLRLFHLNRQART